MNKGVTLTKGIRQPTLPRKVREDIRLTPSELQEINARLPIMPKDRANSGKIAIVKPDLTKSKYFNSKHTTPNDSIDQLNQSK